MTTQPGGPLAGVRVVELAGLGPGPFAAMFLAELGADVVRIDRPGGNGWFPGMEHRDLLNRGKRSILVDLRSDEGPQTVLDLLAHADVLIEGFRPGVMERLGLGPDVCGAVNPRLIYGRMTGWGQAGPSAETAGHDIDYIAVTGLLDAVGQRGGEPTVPLNIAGDFGGGGVYLVIGIVAALHERSRSGLGQVIDAAIVDGAAHLLSGIHAMMAVGAWSGPRGENLLDGGAPFYRTYATSDGGHMAVGAIEPVFYSTLLRILELDLDPAQQNNTDTWPTVERVFADRFAERTLAQWRTVFAGSDACVAPVTTLRNAHTDPHVAARGSVVNVDGVVQSAPAPRFSRTPTSLGTPPPVPGADNDSVLAGWADTTSASRGKPA